MQVIADTFSAHPRPFVHGIALVLLFFLIGCEFLASRWLRRDLFNSNDTLVNLKMYTVYSVILWLFSALAVPLLYVVHDFAPVSIGSPRFLQPGQKWQEWLVLFVAVDFCFYVSHWCCHNTRLFWAAHAGHHSSLHFNLSTGLRQPWTPIFPLFMWLPLSLIGFDPIMVTFMTLLNLNAQIFLHSQLIPNLGPLEWVFNTPSHHRVHHGSNPQYLGKNLGGVLIVWDRMFGTFARESVAPDYGIGDYAPHLNVLGNSFDAWLTLWAELRQQKDGLAALQMAWSSPQAKSIDNPAPTESRA